MILLRKETTTYLHQLIIHHFKHKFIHKFIHKFKAVAGVEIAEQQSRLVEIAVILGVKLNV